MDNCVDKSLWSRTGIPKQIAPSSDEQVKFAAEAPGVRDCKAGRQLEVGKGEAGEQRRVGSRFLGSLGFVTWPFLYR